MFTVDINLLHCIADIEVLYRGQHCTVMGRCICYFLIKNDVEGCCLFYFLCQKLLGPVA